MTRAAILSLLLLTSAAQAADHYVSPTGQAAGAGTLVSPWDLATALAGAGGQVAAGDTIFLTTGTYGAGGAQRFTSTLTGTPGSPITVRAKPGDRAIIDGGIDHEGSWTLFDDLEITNSQVSRTSGTPPGLRLSASLLGEGNAARHLLVYNTGGAGIEIRRQNGVEVYACVLWGNGAETNEGAGIDVQNELGTARVRENIAFLNRTNGLRAVSGTEKVDGLSAEGNVLFNNGEEELRVASLSNARPVQRLSVTSNWTFRSALFGDAGGGAPQGAATFGALGVPGVDATVTGNVFAGVHRPSSGTLSLFDFQTRRVHDNVVISSGAHVTVWRSTEPGRITDWNDSAYYGGTNPLGAPAPNPSYFSVLRTSETIDAGLGTVTTEVVSDTYTFSGWRSGPLGADANAASSPVYPVARRLLVRPDAYEPGRRAQIVLFNWPRVSANTIDLTPAGLEEGAEYELRDAQNPFAPPVQTQRETGVPAYESFIYRASDPSRYLHVLQMEANGVPFTGVLAGMTPAHTKQDFVVLLARKIGEPAVGPRLWVPTTGLGRGLPLGSASRVDFELWIRNTGETGSLFDWTATPVYSTQPVTIDKTSGRLFGGDDVKLTVSIDVSKMGLGLYLFPVRIDASGAAGSPAVVTFDLNIHPNSATPPETPPPAPVDRQPILHVDRVVTALSEATVEYPAGFAQEYLWTITDLTPRGTAGGTASGARWTRSSSSPRLSFADFTLEPGTYRILVRVAEATRVSNPAEALVSVAASNLESVRVFPSPWRADRHKGTPFVTFDGLPASSTVKIFSVSGHLVRELSGEASVRWLLDTDSGDRAASGVYLYLITSGSEKRRGKLALIR